MQFLLNSTNPLRNIELGKETKTATEQLRVKIHQEPRLCLDDSGMCPEQLLQTKHKKVTTQV